MTKLGSIYKTKKETTKERKKPAKRNWIDLPIQLAIIEWIEASGLLRATKVPQIGEMAHPSGLTHYYQRWEDGFDDKKAAAKFIADSAEKGLKFDVTVHNFAFVRRSYFGELTSHPSYQDALITAKQPKLDI